VGRLAGLHNGHAPDLLTELAEAAIEHLIDANPDRQELTLRLTLL
jgi:hypothetical protein